MLSALQLVIPIPLLIFTGWFARRIGLLGPYAALGIDRFNSLLATPALLFNIISHASWANLWQPNFILTLMLSGMLSMCLALFACLYYGDCIPDASIKCFNAGYTNIRFIGLPFILIAADRNIIVEITFAFLLATLFALIIVISLAEFNSSRSRRTHSHAIKIDRAFVLNPTLVVSVAAVIFSIFGMTPPTSADVFLNLLAGAASPCALIALGIFSADKDEIRIPSYCIPAWILCCKLLLNPLLAFVLSRFVFHLSPLATQAVVLLAALPAGTGSDILAKLYGSKAKVSSQFIMLSVLVFIVIISLCVGATQ
ncbi:AEC family transporter [Methylobacterium mesophilicum SR1.6/6]|uniref:AEC family transporter n=1 Tax=Methylobacterium mesophilicum SR1.6/6 TaxID=908290 RepID=A0A6B9FM43_9HYPH|nr:AEC family transporter [Methylobacterium mesophilicum]QGY03613.1 AEC family transporter [Methylobacterium mesophilicum SR1.6/6]